MADPLKYFRIEAREIQEQLERGLLDLERSGAEPDSVARLLRLAHTLKGAARVVKQAQIANLAHQLEDQLVPLREVPRALTPQESQQLLGTVDGIAQHVRELADPPQATPHSPSKPLESAPVESAPGRQLAPSGKALAEEPSRISAAPLEHVEALLDNVSEVGFQVASARHALPHIVQSRSLAEQLVDRLDPRRGEVTAGNLASLRALAGELENRLTLLERDVSTSLERAARELGQVRDRVEQLRLVTVASMFGALERAARDAAVSLGRQATFEARGGEIRLDAQVLRAVERALVQGVRNAVAHGIEPSAERSRHGKPAQGRITLEVERRGKHVRFVCQDDGRGVDLAGVRRQAERQGKVKAQQAEPNPHELLDLLLHGGISTSPTVNEVAGRGVGMDLIREALAGVGGTVELHTQPGAGTRLELSVPASLSALDALLVQAGGELCALPLGSVLEALRLSAQDINRSAEAASILFEEQVIPFVPLASLLRKQQSESEERALWSAIVVRGPSGLVALGVDRLVGSENVVARGLPGSLEVDATVAGVTLDADGNPRLLLDPEALVEAAARAPQRQARPAPRKRSILVIDDSLTTRMLEQSILESAGYEVGLATSAEQGLERARERRYDLFLVDVEMPGMDGFSFVEQVRADARLSVTPAVLVTSRASAADLARGKAAGASGHIAKGEFDQVAFLEQIGRLMR